MPQTLKDFIQNIIHPASRNLKGRLGQKWVSRWTENPKGRSRQKLRIKAYDYVPWNSTSSFITNVQYQFNRLLSMTRDDVWRHRGNSGVGTQWNHFHVDIIFVFTFYSFHSFEDFLILGSLSPCTKMPIYGKNINTNILWSANFFVFPVLSAKVSND